MAPARNRHHVASLAITLLLLAAGPPSVSGAASPPSGLAGGRPASFLVGGWCIAGAYREPDWLVALDAAGFDYVQNLDHHFAPGYGIELLRLLDSLHVARPGFRLRAIVASSAGDRAHAPFTALADVSPGALEAIARTLRTGGPYDGPGCLGYNLWDEPCSRSEMDRLGRVARFVRTEPATAGRLAFTNLMPIGRPGVGDCTEQNFGRGRPLSEGQAAYFDAYLSQFDSLPDPAPVLSFDHYAYQDHERPRADFRATLTIANERALAYGRPGRRIPLWVVVQLGRHREPGRPYSSTPTFAHTRLQAWQALAHGAKGISYWTLFPIGRPEGPRFDHTAWDEAGRAGPDVPALAALNRTLHALGPSLMELDAAATWTLDPAGRLVPDALSSTAPFVRPVAAASLEGGRGELLLGALRHQRRDETWLVVVNPSLERTRTIRLDLAAAADTIERVDNEDGRRTRVGTATKRLEVRGLPPASGALFRIVTRLVEPVPGALEVRQTAGERFVRTRRGILARDRATGACRVVAAMAGDPVPGLEARPAGVFRVD